MGDKGMLITLDKFTESGSMQKLYVQMICLVFKIKLY
jgi:hypothetical protein